jgi:polysaccharide deacetylase 2 family uncharacterized protein YibQ
MAKRKSSKKKSPSLLKKIALWGISSVIFASLFLAMGYYFGYEKANKELSQNYHDNSAKNKTLITELKKKSSNAKKTTVELTQKLQELLQQQKNSASHEYAHQTPPQAIKRTEPIASGLPKVAIIFDDVSFKWDVKNIKNLKLDVTMSFLPPNKIHPNSAKLAAKEPYYMVHLPMEAQKFNKEEPLTLHVNDSKRTIIDRVKKVKKLFPRVEYVNNHTGSKFTASRVAMLRLIPALEKEGITFIDSRTTAQTQAPAVMKKLGKKYIGRDVFLDHHNEVSYIKKQIKKAISVAKEHGTVIAICHPHKSTIRALSESKHLFKGVELVRIDKLYN